MKKLLKTGSLAFLLAATLQTHAMNRSDYLVFEVGPYWPSEGESQNINIVGLAGDRFSVDSDQQIGAIFGVGYLFEGLKRERYGIDYGVNVFYLTQTQVTGDITQEYMFTNLSYRYDIDHIPVYAAAKAYFKPHDKVALTLNAGIGPNFLQTSGYSDTPLNPGTMHDYAFSSATKTTTNFSAMVGVGLKSMVKHVPIEVGYRFFYLGQGSLDPRTPEVLDDLETGTIYVNALMLTISM